MSPEAIPLDPLEAETPERIEGGLDLEGAKRFVAEKNWVPKSYFLSMVEEITSQRATAESLRQRLIRRICENSALLNQVSELEAKVESLETDLEAAEAGYAAGTETMRQMFRKRVEQMRAAPTFDFRSHLARQAAFSLQTFGPGSRVKGVTDHIRKELAEVEKSNGSLDEWIDVVILALDGCWRSGVSPEEVITALVCKQTKNESRAWPDWRTSDPNKAIEHDRSSEAPAPRGDAAPALALPPSPLRPNPDDAFRAGFDAGYLHAKTQAPTAAVGGEG